MPRNHQTNDHCRNVRNLRSPTYRDTELDIDLEAENKEVLVSQTCVASINTLGSRRKSSESHAAKHSEGPDSPLDFDVDAASLPASRDDVTVHATAGPGRKRCLDRAESRLPGTLTGPALLHWLKRHRCARQGDEVEVTVSRSGDRRRGEKCLQEQILFFKDLQTDLEDVFLLLPPEMITSLRCASRKTQKLA